MLKHTGIMVSRSGSENDYPYGLIGGKGLEKGDEHGGPREFIGE